MSAYAHQMEREYSGRSLSSRGGSDMGSNYVMESGFYMTSFAATIFIAALVTVGVLLITLLIALTVMLQSCESRSQGIVEIPKTNENYNYCKIFSLHAELNKLDADDFPEICKISAVQYIKEGQYVKDFNLTMEMVQSYLNAVKPPKHGLDLVLMDVDDFLSSRSYYIHALWSRCNKFDGDDCFEEAKNWKHFFTLKLYMKLQADGWPLILFSRKPETQRNATVKQLISAGYSGWSSLVMRLDEERQMDSHEFFFRMRHKLQNQGFCLKAVISSQMDALMGLYSTNRVFKLPSPFYPNIENSFGTTSSSL
ncbi:Acid phosphatase [Bertholletia excelsa]